jgi:hypothetical protein
VSLGLPTLVVAGGVALGLLVVISLTRVVSVVYRGIFNRNR